MSLWYYYLTWRKDKTLHVCFHQPHKYKKPPSSLEEIEKGINGLHGFGDGNNREKLKTNMFPYLIGSHGREIHDTI